MALKSFLSSLLLAPLALAHPGHKEAVHAHRALPLERRSLDHCSKEFNSPEFVQRTVEINGAEIARLRRALGYEVEEKYGDFCLAGTVAGEGCDTAIVWLGATKHANNTLTGGRAAHIGQIYFDQGLITAAEKNAPYNTNRMPIQQNTRDFLFQAGANGDDPIVRYSLLGKDVSEGLFAWIRFGINQQTSRPLNPAAYWTANGGVMNPTGPISKLPGAGGGGGGWPGFGGGWAKRFAEKLGRKVEAEAEAELQEDAE